LVPLLSFIPLFNTVHYSDCLTVSSVQLVPIVPFKLPQLSHLVYWSHHYITVSVVPYHRLSHSSHPFIFPIVSLSYLSHCPNCLIILLVPLSHFSYSSCLSRIIDRATATSPAISSAHFPSCPIVLSVHCFNYPTYHTAPFVGSFRAPILIISLSHLFHLVSPTLFYSSYRPVYRSARPTVPLVPFLSTIIAQSR